MAILNAVTQIASFAAGASLTQALNVINRIPLGIQVGSSFTQADLTFLVSADNLVWDTLFCEGATPFNYSDAKITNVAKTRAYVFPQTLRYTPLPFQWLKVQSGVTGTPVVQVAANDIRVTFLERM